MCQQCPDTCQSRELAVKRRGTPACGGRCSAAATASKGTARGTALLPGLLRAQGQELEGIRHTPSRWGLHADWLPGQAVQSHTLGTRTEMISWKVMPTCCFAGGVPLQYNTTHAGSEWQLLSFKAEVTAVTVRSLSGPG